MENHTRRRFTDTEDAKIRAALAAGLTAREVLPSLPGRTYQSVVTRMQALALEVPEGAAPDRSTPAGRLAEFDPVVRRAMAWKARGVSLDRKVGMEWRVG